MEQQEFTSSLYTDALIVQAVTGSFRDGATGSSGETAGSFGETAGSFGGTAGSFDGGVAGSFGGGVTGSSDGRTADSVSPVGDTAELSLYNFLRKMLVVARPKSSPS